jgi:MFS superfamily sulfate permease-like transporter
MQFIRNLQYRDVLASFVVFLVALPLCMGVAIASGMPPAAGLVTGIVGGMVVGLFAGSPLQVSGPAAGLTVLVFEIVQRHGVAMLGVVVLAGGLLQLLAGVLKLGRYFRAVPPSVIAGMLAGIGVLILLGQTHVMMARAPGGSGLENLLALPASLAAVLDARVAREAAIVGAVVIGAMALWPKVVARVRRLHLVPSGLVGVVAGTAVAHLGGFQIPFVTLPDSLLGSLSFPTVDGLSRLLDPSVLGAAVALAIIASAETLLCATAVDRMHSGVRTNYDRELAAQGIGNAICGAVGALPMTGVIVRSSANVEAGATTRLSTVLHGTWLLGLVALLPFVLRTIPVPALAGLLVFTGYKLVKQDVRGLLAVSRFEVAIFFTTVTVIVTTDLLKGVLAGLALALAKLVWTFTHATIRVERTGDRVDVHLDGSATFVRLPELAHALETIPPGLEVHLHLEALAYVDHAALELIASWERQYVSRGGTASLDWQELRHRGGSRPTLRGKRLALQSPSGTAASSDA